MNFAILVSQFNPKVTEGLFKGAIDFLESENRKLFAISSGTSSDKSGDKSGDSSGDISGKKITYERFNAPGAFELPLLAKSLIKTQRFDGIICLGCVIKGDTAHFEFISLGTTIGLQTVALETETPVSFGILTTYTEEQAEIRSTPGEENKGKEAAKACLESARFVSQLRSP